MNLIDHFVLVYSRANYEQILLQPYFYGISSGGVKGTDTDRIDIAPTGEVNERYGRTVCLFPAGRCPKGGEGHSAG